MEAAIASNGVRDSMTHAAVDIAIEKGKELRERGRFRKKGKKREMKEKDVVAELEDWLSSSAPDINPLLDMPGMLFKFLCYLSNSFSRCRHTSRHPHRNPTYCPSWCCEILLGPDNRPAEKGIQNGHLPRSPGFTQS